MGTTQRERTHYKTMTRKTTHKQEVAKKKDRRDDSVACTIVRSMVNTDRWSCGATRAAGGKVGPNTDSGREKDYTEPITQRCEEAGHPRATAWPGETSAH